MTTVIRSVCINATSVFRGFEMGDALFDATVVRHDRDIITGS